MVWGTQLRLPYTSCARERTRGEAARTAGHSRLMASASWAVRVRLEPMPKLMPPLAAVPGKTSRLLAPMLAMVFWIALEDPWAISIMAMTAAMPMMMPRVVRAARVLLRVRAMRLVRAVRRNLMVWLDQGSGSPGADWTHENPETHANQPHRPL